MDNKACNVCNKQGLPIFVTRIGFDEKPGLKMPVALPVSYPKIEKHGSYVLSSIRKTGYIYIFDELDNSIYFFKQDAYGTFSKKTIGQFLSLETQTQMHEPCKKDPQRVVNGMLITVPKANTTRKVWLAFSPYIWTNRIIQMHKKLEYRAAHMTPVMVGQQQGEYVCSIKNLAQVNNTGLKSTAITNILNESERLAPGKGIIVALHDPVAVMAEIASSIANQLGKFLEAKGHIKKSASDLTLTNIKLNIDDNIIHKYAKKEINDEAYLKKLNSSRLSAGAKPITGNLSEEKKFQDWKYKQVESEIAEEWGKYSNKLQPNAREQWKKQYQADLKACDQKFIFPLANLHVAWQKSAVSIHYFEKSFDDKDPQSGANYQLDVITAMDNIFTTEPAKKYLITQLQSNSCKPEHFVLNALLLNQQVLKEKAKAALSTVKPALENPFRDLPWDGLFGAHVEACKRVFDSRPDMFGGWLISKISGAVLTSAQSVLNGKIGVGLVAVAMAVKEKFTVLSFVASKNQLLEMVTTEFIEAAKAHAPAALQADLNNPAYIKKLVKYRLRAIRQMAGINLDTQIRVRMVVIQSMLKNASTMQALMNSIELQSAAKLNLSTHWLNAIKTGVTNSIGRVGTKTKSHLSFGAGILTGAFQVFVLNKLLSDAIDPNTMQNSKIENWARLSVGIAALLGTLGAVIDEGIGKLPAQYANSSLGKFVKAGAAPMSKYLGPGAAIASALVDVYKGYSERQEGNTAISNLYFASGIAGGITGVAMFVALSPTAAIPFFGWILAICAGIMIGAAVLIAYLKDNSLQDWVERCSFGKLTEQRYKSLKAEQQELMLAYKGMGA